MLQSAILGCIGKTFIRESEERHCGRGGVYPCIANHVQHESHEKKRLNTEIVIVAIQMDI